MRLSSLRHRFLLVVLLGAIAPMAAAGWWLANASVRSAEQLLRAQLDTSLTTIAADVERRWVYRRADLLFLSGNEVVVRTMTPHAMNGSAADSAFMARLFADVEQSIPRLRFRLPDGTVRWAFGDTAAAINAGSRTPAIAAARRGERVQVEVPVIGTNGQTLGTLAAEVQLSAVLPSDSVPILVKGAQLVVVDRPSARTLMPADATPPPRDRERYAVERASWMAVHRALTAPPLDLSVAAPTRAYVGPFEDAARLGLVVVLGVTLVALLLTVYSTARLTRSLERLVGAADAVAAGDLERNVASSGDDEVGRLARSFNTMIDSLRRTLQELSHQRALAAVGEFAASLSHEVRNGLTAVRVDLQRIDETMPPDDTSGALVSRALQNVERLDSTVTGALAVARSGRAELHECDLKAVLVASAARAETAFTNSQATLSINLDSVPSCSIRGDAAALEQLFLNLLLNAGQALSPGGHASLDLAAVDGAFTVLIRDGGPGIPADQLARTGEPFYSSKRGGTGLGISIARKIAAAHGGDVNIDSRPGVGTVVQVRLPRDNEHA